MAVEFGAKLYLKDNMYASSCYCKENRSHACYKG